MSKDFFSISIGEDLQFFENSNNSSKLCTVYGCVGNGYTRPRYFKHLLKQSSRDEVTVHYEKFLCCVILSSVRRLQSSLNSCFSANVSSSRTSDASMCTSRLVPVSISSKNIYLFNQKTARLCEKSGLFLSGLRNYIASSSRPSAIRSQKKSISLPQDYKRT